MPMEELSKEVFTAKLIRKILFHIKENKVSTRKLAHDCDKNRANIQRLLKGENCPTVYTLYQICCNANIADKIFTQEFIQYLENNSNQL